MMMIKTKNVRLKQLHIAIELVLKLYTHARTHTHTHTHTHILTHTHSYRARNVRHVNAIERSDLYDTCCLNLHETLCK